MGKAGSSSSPPPSARAGAGRSYWIRSGVPPSTDREKKVSPKKPGGKRFVEPYRLSEEQRSSILAPLAARSVGDDESRSLFAAALEYGLASYRRLTEPETDAPPAQRPPDAERDAALATVAAAAESLAARLEQLDENASHRLHAKLGAADRYRRSYGEEYLESLRRELRRIAGVGKLPELSTPTAIPEGAVSEDARRFVLRAADAFEACFELTSDARADSPFVATVAAIAAATGLRVPTEPTLIARILDRDRP